MADRILIKNAIVLTQDPAIGELPRRRRPRRGRHDRRRSARTCPPTARRSSTPPATSSSRASSTPTATPGRRRSGRARRTTRWSPTSARSSTSSRPHYRPDDVYAANQWGALECINAGITTLVDWSHIMNTPDHADAADPRASRSPSIRSVFAYGFPNTSLADWWFGPDYDGQRPDLRRRRRAPDPEAVLQLRRRAGSRWRSPPAARTSASPTSSATTGSSRRSSGSTSPSTWRWTGSATRRCSSALRGHGPALPEHDLRPRLALHGRGVGAGARLGRQRLVRAPDRDPDGPRLGAGRTALAVRHPDRPVVRRRHDRAVGPVHPDARRSSAPSAAGKHQEAWDADLDGSSPSPGPHHLAPGPRVGDARRRQGRRASPTGRARSRRARRPTSSSSTGRR